METCEKCNQESKVFLPYGPHRFCADHFCGFFEKRVGRTIRENELVKPGEKIAVGLSGGKDSAVTLYLLQKFYSKTNHIEAVMIDEGIPGYRDKSIDEGKKLCETLFVPFTVAHYKKEVGHSMEEVKQKIDQNPRLGSTCGFCGVYRRFLLNKLAQTVSANKLATGHNLDDEVQSICMNFFGADLLRMKSLGPIVQEHKDDGFVPRIKPLAETPENEIIAYAAFKEIPHYSDVCCPYSYMAKRNYYRDMLNRMETDLPGTKFSLLSTFKQLKPLVQMKFHEQKIGKCTQCSLPSSQTICGLCTKQNQLLENKLEILQYTKDEKTRKLTCVATKNANAL